MSIDRIGRPDADNDADKPDSTRSSATDTPRVRKSVNEELLDAMAEGRIIGRDIPRQHDDGSSEYEARRSSDTDNPEPTRSSATDTPRVRKSVNEELLDAMADDRIIRREDPRETVSDRPRSGALSDADEQAGAEGDRDRRDDVGASNAAQRERGQADPISEKLATSPDTRPEAQTESARQWKTIAEEAGEVKEYPNYSSAKRDLGTIKGTEIHHIVEQSQAKATRSNFDLSRINTTDNMTRIPVDIHRAISALYSSKSAGAERITRDLMNGKSWDRQYRLGGQMLDKLFEGDQDDED